MVATCPTCGTVNGKYDNVAASRSGTLRNNAVGYVTWMYMLSDSSESVIFWDFGEGEHEKEIKKYEDARDVYRELIEEFEELLKPVA